jgi:hypothetical protein
MSARSSAPGATVLVPRFSCTAAALAPRTYACNAMQLATTRFDLSYMCAPRSLIIIADMLVGAAPEYNGVIPTILGRHDNPWFLQRAFVVSASCEAARKGDTLM